MKDSKNMSTSTIIANAVVYTVFMYGWMRIILKDVPDYIKSKGLLKVAKEKYDSFMAKEA